MKQHLAPDSSANWSDMFPAPTRLDQPPVALSVVRAVYTTHWAFPKDTMLFLMSIDYLTHKSIAHHYHLAFLALGYLLGFTLARL